MAQPLPLVLIEGVQQRIQQNFGDNFQKNLAEEAGKAAARYLASRPFLSSIKGLFERIFGPSAATWVAKGVGIFAATAIGTPNIFVAIVRSVLGKSEAEALRLVNEMVDEFTKTFTDEIALGAAPEQAAEKALNQNVAPTVRLLRDGILEKRFIVHRGAVLSIHEMDCPEVYTEKGRRRIGYKNNAEREREEKDPEKSELIDNAEVEKLGEILAQGIDIEKHSTCKRCGGASKDFKHLSDLPRSLVDARVMLRKSSEEGKALDDRFRQALMRLKLADANEVNPEELQALERKLEEPIWTVERLKLLLEDLFSNEFVTNAQAMNVMKATFGAKLSWPDKALRWARDLTFAAATGKDEKGVLSAYTGSLEQIGEEADEKRKIAEAQRRYMQRRGRG